MNKKVSKTLSRATSHLGQIVLAVLAGGGVFSYVEAALPGGRESLAAAASVAGAILLAFDAHHWYGYHFPKK